MPPLFAMGNGNTLSTHGISGPIHYGLIFMPAVCHNHLTDNTLRWHYLNLFSLSQTRVTLNFGSLEWKTMLSQPMLPMWMDMARRHNWCNCLVGMTSYNSHCHSHVTHPLSGLSFRVSGGTDRIPYPGCEACIFMLTEFMILEGNLPRNRRSQGAEYHIRHFKMIS